MSRIYRTLGTVAMTPKGEYSSSAYYEKLNVVTYNGSSYVALQNTHGNLPTNTTYWQLLAQKGAKTYNNVAEMKADTDLKDGMVAETLGYYANNDDGNGIYKIVDNDTLVDNGGTIHELSNGLKAVLVIENNTISYNQFGAKGDGVNDDYNAIKNTHNYANLNNLPVIGSNKSNYYIKNITESINIETEVNWNNTNFIVDDSDTINNIPLFIVKSKLDSIDLTSSVSSISIGTEKIDSLAGHGNCLVHVVNANHKDFIRYGDNQDEGYSRTDIFRINNDGVLLDTLEYNFEDVTALTLYPIDTVNITIKNGNFKTLCNNVDGTNYIYRNIQIQRSNVTIENVNHEVDETDIVSSSPYYGFIETLYNCNITIKNCFLYNHKTFYNGSTPKGSYDLINEYSINVICDNIQTYNSITDSNYWGIHSSNGCKELYFKNCIINRIDAHRGVHNIYVDNCKIGHQHIKLIGSGLCDVKNTQIYNHSFIELRSDYGSKWDGTINIENCEHYNTDNNSNRCYIIYTENRENWNFGYRCYAPQNINIKDFIFYDTQNVEDVILHTSVNNNADYSKNYADNVLSDKYPYIYTKEMNLKNIKLNNKNSSLVICAVKDIEANYCENPCSAINKNSVETAFRANTLSEFNVIINIDNCEFGTLAKVNSYSSTKSSLWSLGYYAGETSLSNSYRPFIKININNCDYLQLGNSGRMIEYNVENSNIYLISNGGTSCSYGYYNISNSNFIYKYASTPASGNRCFIARYGNYTLNNVHFELLGEYDLDDIYSLEAPFTTLTDNSNWLLIGDNLYNLTFWNGFVTQANSNTTLSGILNDYGLSLFDIFNSNTKCIPRVNGTSEQKPVKNESVGHYIAIGKTYYDTTNSTILHYNGTTWV